MTAQILDGELAAATIKADLVQRVEALAERGITPGLGTILVGDDGPSRQLRGHEAPRLRRAGHRLAGRAPAGDGHPGRRARRGRRLQRRSRRRRRAHPVPVPRRHSTTRPPCCALDPAKDADGLHPVNLGRLVMGVDAPVACTPAGIQALLVHYDIPIAGQHVVIVGRGLTIGRPLANLLTLKRPEANAAVTVVHTGVADLGAYTRQADILVSAAGTPGLITPDMVKPGRGRGRRRRAVRGPQGAARRGRRGGRGGVVDVAPHRRRRAHDPGPAVPQHGRGGRARRRLRSAARRPRPVAGPASGRPSDQPGPP